MEKQKTAVFHCDALPETGLGHLMRCLAGAEEAARRGWVVHLHGRHTPAARQVFVRAVPSANIISGEPERLLETVETLEPEVIHLDSYATELDGLLSDRWFVSNMQDGLFGRRRSAIAIDANLGAERGFVGSAPRVPVLLGASAALIRSDVLRHRGSRAESPLQPRVLVVLGGTDPGGVTEQVALALRSVPQPLRLTIICPEVQHGRVSAALEGSHHRARVRPFAEDLPALASAHDLVITAAGTSVWDFATISLPMGLVCVADNQQRGYDASVAEDMVFPLGPGHSAELKGRVHRLIAEWSEPSGREALRARAQRAAGQFDGLGAWRLVSAWETLVPQGRASSPSQMHREISSAYGAGLIVRAAELRDAATLFEWRNEASTRAASRSGAPLLWESHIAWLGGVLESPERRIFLVEHEGTPCATFRWDLTPGKDWEVSITVAPDQRGRGLAASVLPLAEVELRAQRPVRALATVHRDNHASLRLFRSQGYLPHLPADDHGFAVFAKWLF